MRRLLVTLDDECDTLLADKTNQAEIIREAIKMYHSDINTETIAGLTKTYRILTTYMKTKFAEYDEAFARMDKLISVIESRMM